MGKFSPEQIWSGIAFVFSAIILTANAFEKIISAIKAAKAPIIQQNERLDRLEEWQKEVNKKLDQDRERFDVIDSGTRVTQRALLALLDHGIDGNNIKQMQDAKEELQNHLINR